jgi:hypothetical protein
MIFSLPTRLKKALIISVFLFSFGILNAQNGSVGGTVKDKRTNEFLIGAHVSVIDAQLGMATDHFGYFEITNIPPGTYRLQASMIGYETVTKEIVISSSTTLNVLFLLEETIIAQPEIIVTAEKLVEKTSVSAQTIDGLKLRGFHGLVEDPLRTLPTFPGISAVTEFSTWLCVRGGAPNENLWLLDWVPVYWPFHFGGVKSSFNAEMIEHVELYTGGFPAKFGDKLSSVVNITSRDGADDAWKGKATVSLINAMALIEGPVTEKSSYILSGRRSYYDLVIHREGFTIPSFYDIQAKIKYELTPDQRIYFSGLLSGERALVEFEDPDDSPKRIQDRYIVAVSSIEWKWLVNRNLYSTLAVTFQAADMQFEMDQWWIDGEVYEPGVREDLTWKPNDVHTLKMGVEIRHPRVDWKTFIPLDPFYENAWTESSQQSSRRDTHGHYWVSGFYIQEDWDIVSRLQTNIGLRYDYNNINNKGTVSPRISARYELDVTTALRSAFGYYHQIPTVDELGENQNLDAKAAVHCVLGLERMITPDVKGWIEIYQKDYTKLITFDGSGHYTNDGFGYARGVELFLQSKGAPFSGWISYALSWARRKEYGDETETWFEYDQRHLISIVVDYEFAKTWRLGMKWRYSSGSPYTPVIHGIQDTLGNWIAVNGEAKSARYPDFHQLDVSLHKEFLLGRLEFQVYIEILNAYFRKNVLGYTTSYEDNGTPLQEPYYGLPIVPTIGISLNF